MADAKKKQLIPTHDEENFDVNQVPIPLGNYKQENDLDPKQVAARTARLANLGLSPTFFDKATTEGGINPSDYKKIFSTIVHELSHYYVSKNRGNGLMRPDSITVDPAGDTAVTRSKVSDKLSPRKLIAVDEAGQAGEGALQEGLDFNPKGGSFPYLHTGEEDEKYRNLRGTNEGDRGYQESLIEPILQRGEAQTGRNQHGNEGEAAARATVGGIANQERQFDIMDMQKPEVKRAILGAAEKMADKMYAQHLGYQSSNDYYQKPHFQSTTFNAEDVDKYLGNTDPQKISPAQWADLKKQQDEAHQDSMRDKLIHPEGHMGVEEVLPTGATPPRNMVGDTPAKLIPVEPNNIPRPLIPTTTDEDEGQLIKQKK